MNSSDITNGLTEVVRASLWKRIFNCSCSCPNKGPLWHICCLTFRLWKDIVVKSKPLGLDFYKAASCLQHHGSQFARDCSQLLHGESHVLVASDCSNSEGRKRKERFESSFISVFKRSLLHWHNSVFAYYISHLVDSIYVYLQMDTRIYMYICI